MNHKALIDATEREISGGRLMLDGTARTDAKGKTMVDGVIHEILFEKPQVKVRITGNGGVAGTYAKVNLNGTEYYSDATIVLERGTKCICTVKSSYKDNATIKHNGTVVTQVAYGTKSYTFIVENDMTIALSYDGTPPIQMHGVIDIMDS